MEYIYSRFAGADARILIDELKKNGFDVEKIAVERDITLWFSKPLTDAEKTRLDGLMYAKREQPISYDGIYWAKVQAFTASATKPLKIGRIYKGVETQIDCYVTERIRELYQAGKLTAGDFVLVQFVDGDPDKPIVIEKAYKSW